MSFSLDTKAQSTYGSTAPHTLSYTCGANCTLLVVALCINGTTDRTGGAPTYNGVTMTDSGQGSINQAGGEVTVELWFLENPDTGSAYTISVPNTNTVNMILHASSYNTASGYEASQLATNGSNSGTGNSSNPAISAISDQAGDLCVGVMGSGYRNTPVATHTELNVYDAGNQTWGDQYLIATGPASNSMGWTQSSETWGIISASFEEILSVSDLSISGPQDTTTVSENVTLKNENLGPVQPFDSQAVTEDVTVSVEGVTPAEPSVSDTSPVTENINLTQVFNVSI